MVTKFLARLSFKLLMVISIPLILFGYWPNHFTPAIKLMFMEYTSMALGILGLFSERRRVLIPYPAFLLMVCLFNMFTHGLNQYTQTGVAYVFFFTLAFYSISNFIEDIDVQALTSTLVWCAALNSTFAIFQFFHYSPVFNYDVNSSRPIGFMNYPAHSALLASVGLVLSRRSKLQIPMAACLIIRPEVSVLIGLAIAMVIRFRQQIIADELLGWRIFGITTSALAVMSKYAYEIYCWLISKSSVRLEYWLGAFKHFWSRPLDGWGIGGWAYFSNILFPSMPKNAWLELHNEPLQALFELGILGALLFWFWFKRISKEFCFDKYSLCLIVFAATALFHSIFHFADGIWMFLIIYVLWEATRGTTSKTREPGELTGNPEADRLPA